MTTAPSPTTMPQFRTPDVTTQPVIADVNPDQASKLVRPGLALVDVVDTHDGVIKAKHAEPGQEVRAWLHGQPRGGVRVIDTVTPLGEPGTPEFGAEVEITFLSAHPVTTYKAAYRFYVEALDGAPITRKQRVPALVPYTEV